MNDKIQKDREIASKLCRTWSMFFETFGRLTDIQRKVILPILDGENILISSSTSSGKTEAVCAPLIERYMDNKKDWTILYITPTRALVNDLYERLYNPLSRFNIVLKRKTGDYSSKIERCPNVLLTTPESLDSLLCRGKMNDNHILSNVVAIVLDEIHLLYGSERGEQVKWLLERMKRLKEFAYSKNWCKGKKLQILGLSATISNPQNVIKELIPDAKYISQEGQRELEIISNNIYNIENSLLEYVNNLDYSEKILVFSNKRKRVDDLTFYFNKNLVDKGYTVLAHHGSLTKNAREHVENEMKINDKVIVIATSTLEIGIDIGDVNLVVLDGPAHSISGFLQRVGRGNRRTNIVRVLLCADNKKDALIQQSMFYTAKYETINNTHFGVYYFVIIQQIASYIFQSSKRSRKKETVVEFIKSSSNLSTDEVLELIKRMTNKELLIENNEGLRLGEKFLEDSSSGKIHSVLNTVIGYDVVDDLSGIKIASGIKSVNGNSISIGGKPLDINSISGNQINVSINKNDKNKYGDWNYHSAKNKIKDYSQSYSIRKYLKIDENIWPKIEKKDNIYVFHLGGGIRSVLLNGLSRMFKIDYLEVNDLYIKLSKKNYNKPEWLCDFNNSIIEMYIHDNFEWFEKKLCRPYNNIDLPYLMRKKEVVSWLNIEEELKSIKESEWVIISNNDEKYKLIDLID